MRAIYLVMLTFLAASLVQALDVDDGYVRGMPPGQSTTAAFMTLTNTGQEAVVLTGGSSPVANAVEVHEHSHVDGMMRMRQVERLELAPGESVDLRPGGYHLMFFGLKQVLAEGDEVELVLQYASGEEQALKLPVYSVLTEKQRKSKESGNGR